MKEIRNIVALYDRLKAEEVPCALATVVRTEGSSYRRIGARLLVAADGRYTGGISGGCLEGDALRRAKEAILRATPAKQVYDTLDGDDREIGIGLGCNGRIEVLLMPLDYTSAANQVEVLRRYLGTRRAVTLRQVVGGEGTDATLGQLIEAPAAVGSVAGGRSRVVQEDKEEVLYELLRPEIQLVIVGDNYDVPALLAAAGNLGWRTTVVGSRRKASRSLVGGAWRLYDYSRLEELGCDAHTAVVCMSHDFERDRRALTHFTPLEPPYLGLLGPRKRTAKLHHALAPSGLDLLGFPALFAPIGLDVGAETPEEIAAAVVAEIIAVFRGREGGMLRGGEGTIHRR